MPPRAKTTKKKDAEGGKRYPLNMRTTFEMRQSLEAAAKRSGRSLAQEAEIRIEHSFANEGRLLDALDLAYGRELSGLMLAMGEAMKSTIAAGSSIESLAGRLPSVREWWDSPYVYAEAAKAAETILRSFRPRGDVVAPPATAAAVSFARSEGRPELAELLEGLDAKLESDIGKNSAHGILLNIVSDENERGRRLRQTLGKLASRAIPEG